MSSHRRLLFVGGWTLADREGPPTWDRQSGDTGLGESGDNHNMRLALYRLRPVRGFFML